MPELVRERQIARRALDGHDRKCLRREARRRRRGHQIRVTAGVDAADHQDDRSRVQLVAARVHLIHEPVGRIDHAQARRVPRVVSQHGQRLVVGRLFQSHEANAMRDAAPLVGEIRFLHGRIGDIADVRFRELRAQTRCIEDEHVHDHGAGIGLHRLATHAAELRSAARWRRWKFGRSAFANFDDTLGSDLERTRSRLHVAVPPSVGAGEHGPAFFADGTPTDHVRARCSLGFAIQRCGSAHQGTRSAICEAP